MAPKETKMMKEDIEKSIDALFQLPPGEFTAARNALAKRLKSGGLDAEAAAVKELSKPTISAWAVNQLYWNCRDEFDRLRSAGERLRQAHASMLSGGNADIRSPLADRTEAVSGLLQSASRLLQQSGHSPSPEILRRMTTTLEVLSIAPDGAGPAPGRLTVDPGPTGFDWLAALPSPAPGVVDKKNDRSADAASAQNAFDSARQALQDARAGVEQLRSRLEQASAIASQKENLRRAAEERLSTITAEAKAARQHVQDLTEEVRHAESQLREAERVLKNSGSDHLMP